MSMYLTINRFTYMLLMTVFMVTTSIDVLADPVIKKAPALELPDLDDKLVKLSEYKNKVVAVNFWATWCPPCREELPSMQRTYVDLKDKGLVILAVNVGEDRDSVRPFIASFNLDFSILFDTDNKMMSAWRVLGLPTTFIIDRNGNIAKRITGGRNWNDKKFRDLLTKILDNK